MRDEYKNRRGILRSLRMTIATLLLTSCFLLPACKGGCPFIKRDRPIQPSASSQKKFKAISKLIPESANAIIVADIYKISKSALWDNIVSAEIIEKYFTGLNFRTDVGMIAAFMEISSEIKGPVIFIEGGFQQDLVASKVNQSVKESPYTLAALDSGIVAAATADGLEWISKNRPKGPDPSPLQEGVDWENPIWGRMIVGDDLSLPPPWNGIEGVRLEAGVAEDLAVRITLSLKKDGDITKVTSALEGFKAIEILQRLDDKEMLTAIEKISIKGEGKTITVDLPQDAGLLQLLLAREKGDRLLF